MATGTQIDYTNYFWQGEKMRIRGVRESDAEQTWINRLDTPSRQLLQLGAELPVTVEFLRDRLASLADCRDVNGLVLFTIENLDGEDVGGLSWHTRDLHHGTFSFGITVPRPHRGRGYAADAVRILLRYSFHEQRYHKCNSACIATNTDSIRLHERLGFQREGLQREVVFYDGRYHDEMLFGLTRDEFDAWESRRASV